MTFHLSFFTPVVHAQEDVFEEIKKQSAEARDAAGYQSATKTTLLDNIGGIIKAFLGLLGIIAVVLTIYAGFLWMTAGGNEEDVGKAKKLLGNAVIGLAIILSAYAITAFTVGNLFNATSK